MLCNTCTYTTTPHQTVTTCHTLGSTAHGILFPIRPELDQEFRFALFAARRSAIALALAASKRL
jgi:hypothetical protein